MKLEILASAASITITLAKDWAPALTAAMEKFAINTPMRQAQFIAQCAHESAGFTRTVENLNYSAQGLANTWPSRFASGTGPNELAKQIERKPMDIANATYGGRMGNTAPNDGWLYRGRGLFQLTGKSNYASAGGALGVDLVTTPELVEQPAMAAMTAAWFWSKNGLNAIADSGNTKAVTRTINGGSLGLDDRQVRYERALKALTT